MAPYAADSYEESEVIDDGEGHGEKKGANPAASTNHIRRKSSNRIITSDRRTSIQKQEQARVAAEPKPQEESKPRDEEAQRINKAKEQETKKTGEEAGKEPKKPEVHTPHSSNKAETKPGKNQPAPNPQTAAPDQKQSQKAIDTTAADSSSLPKQTPAPREPAGTPTENNEQQEF